MRRLIQKIKCHFGHHLWSKEIKSYGPARDTWMADHKPGAVNYINQFSAKGYVCEAPGCQGFQATSVTLQRISQAPEPPRSNVLTLEALDRAINPPLIVHEPITINLKEPR